MAGRAKGLRDVIMRVHGPEWWANEMGLPGGDRRPGGVPRWTDEAIRATLAEFLGDRSVWPSWREFNEAGLHAFREALRHHGVPDRWAAEMGVLPRPKSRHKPRRSRAEVTPSAARAPRMWPLWTDARIEHELDVFLAGRQEWPRYGEFVAAGRKNLYQAVLRHGGTDFWAQRLGVRPARRHGARSKP